MESINHYKNQHNRSHLASDYSFGILPIITKHIYCKLRMKKKMPEANKILTRRMRANVSPAHDLGFGI